ncbi:MAG: xanthine dehydrogenase family protein molybdopterin-binding subunit [Bacillota bacterium]|nr:xanthine dehydrogenase family protein molybdopterin-binding subunit [Bacillota bacterium]
MHHEKYVGKSQPRRDGRDKLRGKLRYLGDRFSPHMLHAALVVSPHGHALIKKIDVEAALKSAGVRKVLTGDDITGNIGIYLGDKPPLARKKVRHYGEPVAAVVADSEAEAKAALSLVEVEYEPLKVISSPSEALAGDAPLLHEDMASYSHISAIFPEPGSNISNRTKIRKGDIETGFKACETIIEDSFSFPPGDHVAMETRASTAEILDDGQVIIHSTTQAPFVVRNLLSTAFDLPVGKITVITYPLGGGFGGKAGIQLEGLAYLLSKSVGGRLVRLVNSRENDLVSSPGRTGLEARVKLGCSKDGLLQAAEIHFCFDSGAYADYAVNISRAAAIACTGPYNVANVWCDSLCVYTNHPFATAYRGFGHIELAFAMERAVELLAEKAGIDPLEFRLLNAIREGNTTPTNSRMDSNTGDLRGCLLKVSEMLEWEEGNRKVLPDGKVRAKSVSVFWKAPAMPTNADGGAILTFNEDGTINLHCGVIEIGQGIKTALAQVLAEKMGIKPDQVHVVDEVNTRVAPHDWATAASRSLFMIGRALLEAADDAIRQLRRTASIVLKCPPEDLAVGEGRVYLVDEPEVGLSMSEVALGYMYPEGQSIEGQVIGVGRYISRRLTAIDPETGAGRPALEWTMGSQGIEVELNPADGTYRVVKAVCAMDVGRVINPFLAHGQIVGGMSMGLGFAGWEGFSLNRQGRVINDDLRSYKILRYGEEPEYLVEFLETPQRDGPFCARGLGEQGVLGMPGALAGALSRALGRPLNRLPLTPQRIWEAGKEAAK